MRPSELELGQNWHFLANFGVFQASPIYRGQHLRNWLFGPDSGSLAQIPKIETIKEPCYVVRSPLEMKNGIFCPKKCHFSLLAGMLLHSIAFLWSQSSGFEPNFRNQVRKVDFRATTPGRLVTLEKTPKMAKKCQFQVFTRSDGSKS